MWEPLKLAEEAGSLKAAMVGVFTPQKSVNAADQSFFFFFFDRDLVNKRLPGHCWVHQGQSFSSSLLQDWHAVTQEQDRRTQLEFFAPPFHFL